MTEMQQISPLPKYTYCTRTILNVDNKNKCIFSMKYKMQNKYVLYALDVRNPFKKATEYFQTHYSTSECLYKNQLSIV